MTKALLKYKTFELPLLLFAVLHHLFSALNCHKVPDAQGIAIDQRRGSRLL